MIGQFPNLRMRRLRKTHGIRELASETQFAVSNLILPLFIKEGKDIKHPLSSMPGHFQLSLDRLSAEIDEILSLGINKVILFGIPKIKDAWGKNAYDAEYPHCNAKQGEQRPQQVGADVLKGEAYALTKGF